MTRNQRQDLWLGHPISQSEGEEVVYRDKWIQFIEAYALSRYKWNGLPEHISERNLEAILFYHGEAVLFKDAGIAYATQVVKEGMPNPNGDYSKFRSIGPSNWNYDIPEKDGIIVYDSLTRLNKIVTILLFAQELTDIDLLEKVNLHQQRTTVVFTGPSENMSDLKNLAKDLRLSKWGVLGHKNLKRDMEVKAIRTDVPYMQEQFTAHRMAKLNSLYSFLGIDNLPFDKAERMITAEADASSDSIARIREDALLPRREAAEKFNDRYGTNITVEWRVDEQNSLTAEGAAQPTQPKGDA